MRLAILSLAFAGVLAFGANFAVAQDVAANVSAIPYVTASADTNFLGLPIPPHELLAGKMILVYVTDAALGLFVMAVSLVVYGIKEGPGLLFYLDGIVDALALPLLPIAITSDISVPHYTTQRNIRN